MEKINRMQLALGVFLYVLLSSLAFLTDPLSMSGVLGLVFGGAYIIRLSLKNFGGINGDCIGAVAEIVRAGSLLIMALAVSFLA